MMGDRYIKSGSSTIPAGQSSVTVDLDGIPQNFHPVVNVTSYGENQNTNSHIGTTVSYDTTRNVWNFTILKSDSDDIAMQFLWSVIAVEGGQINSGTVSGSGASSLLSGGGFFGRVGLP